MRRRGLGIRRAAPVLGGLLFALTIPAAHADPATDWQRVVELDAGPRIQARSLEDARAAAAAHVERQEAALRAFLAANPGDAHGFEARLRLARILGTRGEYEDSEKARAEARRILAELEKSATPEQRVELDFARVTAVMRTLRTPSAVQREGLLSLARKFQSEHPADRRVASLLAEVATLFDAQPKTKRALLTDAHTLSNDDDLRSRLRDDLKRLDLLGSAPPLRFKSAQGKAVDVADFRGKVVIVLFFAAWSPPSTGALAEVQRAAAGAGDRVQIVGVSLDEKPETVAALVKQHGIAWPVAFDGKGWESPLVRELGVNALPTAWLLDKAGRLRSLNALESTGSQLRQLLDER